MPMPTAEEEEQARRRVRHKIMRECLTDPLDPVWATAFLLLEINEQISELSRVMVDGQRDD